jgi:hypothetical protein
MGPAWLGWMLAKTSTLYPTDAWDRQNISREKPRLLALIKGSRIARWSHI